MKNALSQRLSLQLTDVTIEDALDAVMKEANVSIVYSKAVVPVAQRVSVSGKEITVEQALRQVLNGTGTKAHFVGEGKLAIVTDMPSVGARVTDGVVLGRIIHAKTKQPVRGANITVNGVATAVMSDEKGTFRVTLPAGRQILNVRALGFVRQAVTVQVAGDGQVSVEVVLEPSASVLDEVVVTGTIVATERKAITTPITVITAEEIERRGITRVEQLLRGEVPGVLALERGTQVYNAGSVGNVPIYGSFEQSKVYARGSSQLDTRVSTPLKTYVDGVELLDDSYLGIIDPSSIERIEILTGPQAATVYGSGAMGGVMQIFTKKGASRNHVEFNLNAKVGILENNLTRGLTPSHQHVVGATGGNGVDLTYSGTISYNYTGQWQPKLFSRRYGTSLGLTYSRGPLTTSGSFSTTAGSNGEAGNAGTVRLRDGGESGRFAPWLASSQHAYTNANRVSRSASQTLAFNADLRIGQLWQHHLTLGRAQNNFAVESTFPRFYQASDTLLNRGATFGRRLSGNYNTTFATPHDRIVTASLSLGADGSSGMSSQMFGCKDDPSDSRVVGCSSAIGAYIIMPVNSEQWGGFASLRTGFFNRLYVTLGLRAERASSYGSDHRTDWTPTNGIAYTMEYGELSVKLLGSYGRSTRPPPDNYGMPAYQNVSYYDPGFFLSRFGNPDLTPEYSRGPQGGIEVYYGNRGSLTINRYVQRVSDLIQSVVVDTVYVYYVTYDLYDFPIARSQYRNVAEIRQHGWEMTGTLNIARMSAKATYSWMDSRVVKSNAPSYPPGMVFEGTPTHSGNLTIGYSTNRTSVSLVNNYVGALLMGATVPNRYSMLYYDRAYGRLSMYGANAKGIEGQYAKPGYIKSDLILSHRISQTLHASVTINNLNNGYGSEVSDVFPALGRHSLLGFSYRFSPR